MVVSLFDGCYAPAVVGLGGVVWERRCWPERGELRDQDPWLLAALEWVAHVRNALLRESSAPTPAVGHGD